MLSLDKFQITVASGKHKVSADRPLWQKLYGSEPHNPTTHTRLSRHRQLGLPDPVAWRDVPVPVHATGVENAGPKAAPWGSAV